MRRASGRWLIRRASGPVTIDGDLSEFAHAPAVSMVLHDRARATARLMYDDRYLYLACDVEDDSPWKNAGSDLSTLFKTGDTIDLWLGPSAGKRELSTRDVRVLFAPQESGTVAVAFRPKVVKNPVRVPFRSPSGEVWMDKVERLADVSVVTRSTPGGYRLEAAIPRSEIGSGRRGGTYRAGSLDQLQRSGRPAKRGPHSLGPQRRGHRLRSAQRSPSRTRDVGRGSF